MRTLRRFAVLLTLAICLSWCGYRVAFAQTPPTDEQLAQGAQLFAENCAVCHGASGEGRVGATLAKDWPSIRPDLTVRNIIINGIEGSPMPAWSATNGGPLSDTEIDALVAYILSWQVSGYPKNPPIAAPVVRPAGSPIPNVTGDPENGAQLYAQNCVMCHGSNGEGRIGATLAKNFPSIRPDLTIQATIRNGISGSPMPAWSVDNGGPLSNQEIADLAAYILSWEQPSPLVTETSPAEPSTPLPGSSAWVLWVILLIGLGLFGFLGMQDTRKP
ncbi:MAG: hypothetical protein OHK0052_26310 [Anaerolineales bacterium]